MLERVKVFFFLNKKWEMKNLYKYYIYYIIYLKKKKIKNNNIVYIS